MLTISATCECPGNRYLPIRVTEWAAEMMGGFDPDKILLTYRCGDCQSIIEVKSCHLPVGVAKTALRL